MTSIYEALQEVKREVQVVFLCGHNKKLYEDVSIKAAGMRFATVVLPFYDRMSELMSAVDLMVTKASGLTTFEAVARRLPMAIDMITEPMPQEAGNVELLLEAGVGKPIRKPSDIVALIEKTVPETNRLNRPLPKLHNLDKTTAAYDIARAILEYALPKQMKSAGRQKSLGTSAASDGAAKVIGLK